MLDNKLNFHLIKRLIECFLCQMLHVLTLVLFLQFQQFSSSTDAHVLYCVILEWIVQPHSKLDWKLESAGYNVKAVNIPAEHRYVQASHLYQTWVLSRLDISRWRVKVEELLPPTMLLSCRRKTANSHRKSDHLHTWWWRPKQDVF